MYILHNLFYYCYLLFVNTWQKRICVIKLNHKLIDAFSTICCITKARSKIYVPKPACNGHDGCQRDDEAWEARQQKSDRYSFFKNLKFNVYILELARNSRDGCKKDFQSRQDYRSKSLIIFPDFLNLISANSESYLNYPLKFLTRSFLFYTKLDSLYIDKEAR